MVTLTQDEHVNKGPHRPVFSQELRAEAIAAREAFLTSTSAYVLAIVSIDGQDIGYGRPGPVTTDLLERYRRHVSGNTFL